MTVENRSQFGWVEDKYGTLKLTIGPLCAVVAHYAEGEYAWWIQGVSKDDRDWAGRLSMSRPMPRAAAKAAAEAKLRECYEALRDQFDATPVLEWWLDEESEEGDPRYCARIGKWMLHASNHCWSLCNDRVTLPLSDGGELGVAENRRAAEDALRSMSVTFR